MKQAEATLTPERIAKAREHLVTAATFFRHFATGADAERELYEAIRDSKVSVNRAALENAVLYYRQAMQGDVEVALEEACTELGIDYKEALEGSLKVVS